METNAYLVDIVLPTNNGNVKFFVEVTRGELGIEEDVLIGMDIIQQGDFAVTNFNKVTKFSFRKPSLEHIDFEQQPTDAPPRSERG